MTVTPCRLGDLWPDDPISGMIPKDRLAKVISNPNIVSFPGWVALGRLPISDQVRATHSGSWELRLTTGPICCSYLYFSEHIFAWNSKII